MCIRDRHNIVVLKGDGIGPEIVDEAVKGAKNVIRHLYNSTSTRQRKVVFKKDMPGIIDIAGNGARLIKKLSDELMETSDINIRYESSPESFTGTEMDNAVERCV